jgi:hypothetical protein
MLKLWLTLASVLTGSRIFSSPTGVCDTMRTRSNPSRNSPNPGIDHRFEAEYTANRQCEGWAGAAACLVQAARGSDVLRRVWASAQAIRSARA